METRSRTAERRLVIADGTNNPIDERVQRVEETLNDMGDHLGQVNQRLDQIFDGIDALVRTVAATQEATQQSAATVIQFQDVATQAAAAVAELQVQIGVVDRVQELAQRTAEAVNQMRQQPSVQTPTPAHQTVLNTDADVDMEAPTNRKLRKMDTKPPTFDGDIDGRKLRSFIFQFESYFSFKGYNLEADDVVLALELGQSVRKSAATWYETYMTSQSTMKTWSSIKSAMEKSFKEPNFQQKMRNELLNFKQRGTYQGYVAKFQEKLRLVPLDPAFAKEIFLRGLTSNNLRKQILRKKPTTLEDVIAEGFSEVELERLDDNKQPPDSSKQKSGSSETKNQQNQFPGKTEGRKRAKCHHCQRGYHEPGECWLKFPEKRPKSTDKGHRGKRSTNDNADYKSKYYALIDKLVVDNVEATSQPLNE